MQQQREVKDTEGLNWVCVQSLATVESLKDTEVKNSKGGEVIVVCTPSGGAQTVRLQLPQNWFDELDDKTLLTQIQSSRS